ncbi:MAG: Mov34/MPN/PAD-1 family protein [Limisphaerales bacterium]
MNGYPDTSTEIWERILTDVESAYPAEGCGLILVRGTLSTRVRPCTNAQMKYHELDPAAFPRTDRNAYFIEPRELLQVERELRETGEKILGIYHSHPDAEAYFSEEDQAQAMADGEPIHPGTGYLVLSVREGKTRDHKWFAWDGEGYSEVSSVGSD